MELFTLAVGPLQENCYILSSQEGNALVVDPGDEGQRIAEFLRSKSLTPTKILLTHAHYDHVGAVKELKEAFGVEVYANELEEIIFASTKRRKFGARAQTDERYDITPDVNLSDGDIITQDELSVSLFHTPGHTPGSSCYLCGEYMFSGDTLFAGDIGRCDLLGGDYEVMKQSLEKLKTLKEDYTVLPGHGPSSTLERERQRNPYMTGEAL